MESKDQTYIGVGGTSNCWWLCKPSTSPEIILMVTSMLLVLIVNPGLGYTVGETVSIGGSSVGGFDLAQGAVKILSGVTTFTTFLQHLTAHISLTGDKYRWYRSLLQCIQRFWWWYWNSNRYKYWSQLCSRYSKPLSGNSIGGTSITTDDQTECY